MTLIYNFTSVSILAYFFSQWVENINKNLPLGYMFILMVKCNTCYESFLQLTAKKKKRMTNSEWIILELYQTAAENLLI